MAAPVDANAAQLVINNPQPRLPPEIFERIIDHLDPWTEEETLLNCALVCQGWYTESRAVLFETPRLHTRKEAAACARSLTRIPLLGACVQWLSIGSVSETTITTGPELGSILVMLAGKLPKLASLAFTNVSFEQCSTRNLAFWSLSESSHLTSLELWNVTLPSASPFFQLICSFPHLQHLKCRYLHWSERRSMAPLPEHHRMPLTTVTFLGYDMSCFEHIGHILLGLLDRAVLENVSLTPQVSAAALAFTQGMLNIAGRGLEIAEIEFNAPEEDADGDFQSLLLHPVSFEANVNLQKLILGIDTSKMNVVALFVQSVLLPLLNTVSSKHLNYIRFSVESHSKWETDALLNAFDPEVCIQIDELLAEGHFAELRDLWIDFAGIVLNDSQRVNVCTEICARFPKLNDKNRLTIYHGGHRFPSDTEGALKGKQLADKQPHPIEQTAA
ncbi:uncharacterized protein LAESUDRAFT_730713 [Laetiporus sulphureus 93-53]|uniref:F-box domain-containing protein n=1 Tax=Laetiporus sulphureus 93-53 TaxID=1314785 RepID=A0A165C0Y8_9APHY|nr:uncharacterized protein LAESUDRAFT_730713 [Laetiporus sulphureus 93-53]KZT02004.1 hypothetical protein LAESUDRAFT_730713 [Laetiporus sulphureus 93-53]